MFGLETTIAEWRHWMQMAGLKAPELLDELEGHLREDIRQHMSQGMDERLAFELAAKRMGPVSELKDEFMKIDDEKSLFNRRLMDIAFGAFAIIFPAFMAAMMLFGKTGSYGDMATRQRWSGVAALVLFALLAWAGKFAFRFFPIVFSKRTRGMITAACAVPLMIWWYVFLAVIAQHHDYSLSQFGVTFLWAFVTPAGLMMGVVWGLETAARKQSAG